MQQFIFDASKTTPEQLARKRAIADAMMQRSTSGTPRNLGEGLTAISGALVGNILGNRIGKEESARTSAATSNAERIFGALMGGSGGMAPSAPAATPAPANWDAIKSGIFAGESGGDYNALFNYSNRDGKPFAGTDLTRMTVDQALAFADPKGPYAQYVKSNVGRVATPMGAYQVVGSTLKDAKQGLGLTGQEQMTPELQDKIGQWIYGKQGTGAWAGYKGPQPSSVAALQDSGYPMGGQSLPQSQPAQMPSMTATAAMQPPQGGQPMPIQPGNGSQVNGATLAPMGGGPSMQQLLQVMSNPYSPPEYKQVAGALLQQQLGGMDPSKQLDMEYKRAQIAKMRSGGGGTEYGLNPQYGVDESGNPVLIQIGKDGTSTRTPLPEGVSLSKEPIKMDAGTHWVLLDPITRQAVGMVPKDNMGAARDTAVGKEQGEAVSDYQRQMSKLPELEKVVDQLGEIGKQATYTWAGQGLDFVRKEAGMEPRDAAVARTKYIAMVDNQILPLLRDTFGAAFTVKEGETLRATLGDPNKTPEEKQVVLKAFIEQKRRNVESLGRQIGATPAMPQAQAAPAQSSGPAQISSQEEYNALPSGAQFIDPNGALRRKP